MIALILDMFVARLGLLAYRVRSFPVLRPRELNAYLMQAEQVTMLDVPDSSITMYDETAREVQRKSRLVTAALVALLLAVMATAAIPRSTTPKATGGLATAIGSRPVESPRDARSA
jgi:hypothetical protein